jgi:hypothetical protein
MGGEGRTEGQQDASMKSQRTLGEKLEQQFKAYSAAAGAAGMGLLALAQSTQAEVVYTPAHIRFTIGSSHWIDLNHDGLNDFRIEDLPDRGLGSTTFVIATGLHGDGVGVRQDSRYALPLPLGARIGPSNIFSRGATMAIAYHGSGGGTWGKNHYLALEFVLDGQKHYGWAELSIALNQQGTVAGEIEGYAYETIANKPIRAGATKEQDNTVEPLAPISRRTPAPVPATLGLLALGSPGLSYWRRQASPLTDQSSRPVAAKNAGTDGVPENADSLLQTSGNTR